MEPTFIIRNSVARVVTLRQLAAANPELASANRAIKCFQATRFKGSYRDLLSSPSFSGAARFFLDELYGDKDYTLRDAQFSRIANALQKFFPEKVVDTAVALSQLHASTEELDQLMAEAWLQFPTLPDLHRYMAAWKKVGRIEERKRQLVDVLRVGQELESLTRKAGLRTMLRMMRRPAEVAGLGELQSFLEKGFDTFAVMSRSGSKVSEFLEKIEERESEWFLLLFGNDNVLCEQTLQACISKA